MTVALKTLGVSGSNVADAPAARPLQRSANLVF